MDIFDYAKARKMFGGDGGSGGGSFILRTTLENWSKVNSGVYNCTANFDEMAKALEAGLSVSIVMPSGIFDNLPFDMRAMVNCWLVVEGTFGVFLTCPGHSEYVIQVSFTNGTYIPTV